MANLETRSQFEVFPQSAPGETSHPEPNYAASFHCISTSCEDNCCNGWTIPVDRRTVRAYQAHPTLAPFAQLLILNTENPSSGDYARMPLTHSGNCAFLNPDKLCGIHQHFGSELLSVACNTYPRETSYQFGKAETALNFSCPEAARHTLLDRTLMDGWRRLPLGARLAVGSDPARAIRDFLIRLMLERSQPLAHRLALMGELCQRIPSLQWALDNRSEIANLLLQTAAAAHAPVKAPRAARPAEMNFVTSVLAARIAAPPVPNRFRDCLREFTRGLFPDGDASKPARFGGAESPFLLANPHLMENYLANHIFKYSYPFGHKGEVPPHDAHRYLAGLQCLIQTLLVGSEAYHRESFDWPNAIKVIQSFSRAIEHRSVSREEIIRLAAAHQIGQPTALHLVSMSGSRRARPANVASITTSDSHKLALC